MDRNIKILLADDHEIVIDGLRLILESHEKLEIIGAVQNGKKVLDFIETTRPDIVVMDINMPEMDGITCSRQLKEKYPEIKIIILTMYAQQSFIEEIIKIGIDGCLLKNNTGKELKDAIIRVDSGKSYYDQIQNFDSKEESLKSYKLGAREVEIIKLLAEGLNSIQIGEKLFISEHTVRTHRKNILRKLDLHNTSELVQYALNNQII